MLQNLLDTPKRNRADGDRVIPTNSTAKKLRISYALLDKCIDKVSNRGLIRYQARIDDEDNSRPILGFEVPYIDEILGVLGKVRGPGKVVFTPEAKDKIAKINQRWGKQYKIMR